MDVRVTRCDVTNPKATEWEVIISVFHYVAHKKLSWMVKWNGPFWSDWPDEERWSTSKLKSGPTFSKLFRLDQTDAFSFRPRVKDILNEWRAPIATLCIGLREVTEGTAFTYTWPDYREVKHDVWGKWQMANGKRQTKMKLLPSLFSCVYSTVEWNYLYLQ